MQKKQNPLKKKADIHKQWNDSIGLKAAEDFLFEIIKKCQDPEEQTEELKKYIIDKFKPNKKGSYVKLKDMPRLLTIEDVGVVEMKIGENMFDGKVSVEEAERMYAVCEGRRRQIETELIINRLKQIKDQASTSVNAREVLSQMPIMGILEEFTRRELSDDERISILRTIKDTLIDQKK